MAARNIVNKVRYNNGILEDLCFNKDNISLGISSDYKISDSADNLPDAYAESCFTGWYQSVSTTNNITANTKSNYVLLSNKPPGGSVQLPGTTMINISDSNLGYTALSCKDFTLEMWIYVPDDSPNIFTTPIITNGDNSSYSQGYKIEVTHDGLGNIYFNTYLGSISGNWDILNSITEPQIAYGTNMWHHICLSRKDNIIKFSVDGNWIFAANSNLCISSANTSSFIGGFRNSTVNKGTEGFYFTNLRFLFGMVKYNLNSNFTVPTYPISAIGNTGSTITVPLLFNAFQNTKKFFNHGQRNFTIIETGTMPWSSNTPFLYDIPRIYKWGQTANANDFITNMNNIAKNIDGSGPFTTFQEVTNWYRGKNNVFINNFECENIPTSGLTYYYDPEHIMSFPGAVDFSGHTGSSVYNLVNNSTSVLDIKDPNNFRTDELYTTTNNYFDIKNLTINSAFTAVVVFRKQNNSFNYTSLIVGVTGVTSQNVGNGFTIEGRTTTKELTASIYNSGTTKTTILGNYTNYTLTAYTMFALSSNGIDNHKVHKNGTNIITDTSTIRRTSNSRNVYFGLVPFTNNVEELNYKLFCLYNRQLTEDEIDRLYKRLQNRMGISI